MNKNRLEGLSDAVFAIVMTILVIDFQLPETSDHLSFYDELHLLIPTFFSYGISFMVLNMFWVSHNALFHIFTKNVNRIMIQLNMLYLALMALIPFSAHMLGSHLYTKEAVIFFGINIFFLGIVNYIMFRYAMVSHEIDTDHVSSRTVRKASIRVMLGPLMTVVGMGAAFVSIPAALVLYAFPIVFNIIPGGLDWMEKRFGLDLGEGDLIK